MAILSIKSNKLTKFDGDDMKTLLTFVSLMIMAPPASAANFQVDPSHSSVIFRVGHMGISNLYGRFNDVSGTFATNDATEQLSAISIKVKSTSVDTGVSRRDNHLRSADFFNATMFPEISFVSTSVTVLENGSYEISGDLSLHGVTKSLTFTAVKVGSGQDAAGNPRVGGEGSLSIKRSDYGMTGLMSAAGDDIRLQIAFEGQGL